MDPWKYTPDQDMDFSGGGNDQQLDDGLLDLGQDDDGGDGEDMSLDPRDLGLDQGQDIERTVDMGTPSDEDTSEGVEQDLIDLLEQGGHATLIVLSGERPNVKASVSEDTLARFQYVYAKAARINPALRWYAKFAALLPPEKFGVHGGVLRISMSPKVFSKVVGPFLGDFQAKLAMASPIVGAVRHLAAVVRQADMDAKHLSIQKDQHGARNSEAADFDPAGARFETQQVPDAAGRLVADLTDGDDGLGEDGIAPNPEITTSAIPPRATLSLTDLSHKAIADHLAEQGGDENSIMQRMMDEGFTRSRANEVAAMVRYKRLMTARRAGRYVPEGNTGTGFAEFTAR